MYLGMRSAIQRTVDRALNARVEEMRQFLWRHRRVSQLDLPEHFRRSSEIQPGEELFQVADSSGAWVYQAPMMEPLHIPAAIPDPCSLDKKCAPINTGLFFQLLRGHTLKVSVMVAL
jgi:hypothetical protein